MRWRAHHDSIHRIYTAYHLAEGLLSLRGFGVGRGDAVPGGGRGR